MSRTFVIRSRLRSRQERRVWAVERKSDNGVEWELVGTYMTRRVARLLLSAFKHDFPLGTFAIKPYWLVETERSK